MENEKWPRLSYEEGKATYETIHLWTQILGKIKLTSLPWISHSWHVTLLITPTGLTTGDLPSEKKDFQINLDFLENQLTITTSQNEIRTISLLDLSVAQFYEKLMNELKKLGIAVVINKVPNELVDPIAFDKDQLHSTYVPKVAEAFQHALLKSNKVFTEFRSRFIGKCSPVHFFWGSFDLAVSRFSGRKAPEHPGGFPNLPDRVAREAYSHEVSSCGFWPGNEIVPFAAFYSYIYPEPDGFSSASVKPEAAYYHKEMGEFILPYAEAQRSENPEKDLMDFLQSTYEAAADLAKWDRKELERFE
ncbi:DUF5996 family protein [Salinimicrobium catena]|uniref:DUF5996 family protein n=1 Tax=Salinimicrobium catena TaxID=390640 RepID=UPI002FE453C2